MSEAIKDKILYLIQKKGRGTVFSSQDFIPKFKRWEVDRSLTDLEKEGKIIRIIPGFYAFPRYSQLLKEYVTPDMGISAQGIAKKNDWKIFPEGNTALLYLGLSTQVPAKYIYLSSGRHRKYNINGTILEFKELNSKTISINDKNTNLVVQSIAALGKIAANEDDFVKKLSKCFSHDEWIKIEYKAKKVTSWILEVIAKAKELSNEANS